MSVMSWNFALRGFTVCGLRFTKLRGGIPHDLCARATQRLLVVTSAHMSVETAVGLKYFLGNSCQYHFEVKKGVLNDDYSRILGHKIRNQNIHTGQDDAIGHGFDNSFTLLTLDSDMTCDASVLGFCNLSCNAIFSYH